MAVDEQIGPRPPERTRQGGYIAPPSDEATHQMRVWLRAQHDQFSDAYQSRKAAAEQHRHKVEQARFMLEAEENRQRVMEREEADALNNLNRFREEHPGV